jgi:hypothetical protein
MLNRHLFRFRGVADFTALATHCELGQNALQWLRSLRDWQVGRNQGTQVLGSKVL